MSKIASEKRAIVRSVVIIAVIIIFACDAWSQEKKSKIRISNAGFTLTALPLLAAKDWGVFSANGLDVELIVMSPTLAAAAVAQGDIDYVAGVGPASVAATLSGLPSRAIWFSSDRITYWLQVRRRTRHCRTSKARRSRSRAVWGEPIMSHW